MAVQFASSTELKAEVNPLFVGELGDHLDDKRVTHRGLHLK
jgi:hypothetical protein